MSINKLLNQSFAIAQVKPKEGVYTLETIQLNEIDVVYKGIANREFFYWDTNINKNIDWIKEKFNELPPIILEEYNGKYYSVDGHHRITAAIELNKTNILAFVIKVNKLTYKRK